jgi:hypothetical protein
VAESLTSLERADSFCEGSHPNTSLVDVMLLMAAGASGAMKKMVKNVGNFYLKNRGELSQIFFFLNFFF